MSMTLVLLLLGVVILFLGITGRFGIVAGSILTPNYVGVN